MIDCDPFVYCFIVGGIIFSAGLVVAFKQGYLDFSARGIRNLAVCVAVFAFFFGVQGYLQYGTMRVAPTVEYQGGAEEVVAQDGHVRGHPIDYVIMCGYFLVILAVGTWFGRRQKTTKDFFFGGQRFSWWLIAFSLIATTIGSYSFVKYSNVGFTYGLASSQTYMNDWLWFPLIVFGWLPILYFSRVTSIPEYFDRRFGGAVRAWATIYILIYLVGYVGVNLFTMGTVLHSLLGWPVLVAAAVVAAISASYVTVGGQTSVIMTDLLQGVMLLFTGLLILVLGMHYLGGFEAFWENLPRDARLAYANFNTKSDFPSVGIFWQDAVANSAMLYFLNQGIAMRFLATRSLADGRKAVLAMVLVLMPIGACVVGSGGWVARALVNAGALPADIEAKQAFYIATEFLSKPGVFGLILAALTAALMSTVDTLITAVSAIAVNDVYRPYIAPDADERRSLRAARICALSVTVIGVLLVPIFMQFKSIYSAHGAFTAAVTPPLVVTLLFSAFWRRFTRKAALATLVGGMIAIVISLIFPQVIAPFAHGVPMKETDGSFLAGITQYKFMRAFFGIVVSAFIGIVVTAFTRPESEERQSGLVWGTIAQALRHYKGSPGTEASYPECNAAVKSLETEPPLVGEGKLPAVTISKGLAEAGQAAVGDLLYVSDRRRWLGGLRSSQAIVDRIDETVGENVIWLGSDTFATVVARSRKELPLRVRKLY